MNLGCFVPETTPVLVLTARVDAGACSPARVVDAGARLPPRVIIVDSHNHPTIPSKFRKLLRASLKVVWRGLKWAIGPLLTTINGMGWRIRVDLRVHLNVANGSGDVVDRSFGPIRFEFPRGVEVIPSVEGADQYFTFTPGLNEFSFATTCMRAPLHIEGFGPSLEDTLDNPAASVTEAEEVLPDTPRDDKACGVLAGLGVPPCPIPMNASRHEVVPRMAFLAEMVYLMYWLTVGEISSGGWSHVRYGVPQEHDCKLGCSARVFTNDDDYLR
ncbi:hypothetical protein EDB85DRAFT_1900129 [Lactarius pseudohatsudake]|nr:hypothetical protein EDB85DRAFT_1900129 [Lactarius pseudohatsudake]